jgi:hypothetical protein
MDPALIWLSLILDPGSGSSNNGADNEKTFDQLLMLKNAFASTNNRV